MKVAIVFILSIVGVFASPSNRIINGQDAEEGQFPYQVSVVWGIKDSSQHICGGSIITPEWILTAGHCITNLPFPGLMTVKAGLTDLTDKEFQEREVIERIIHPDYKGGVNPNDIALLRLDDKLVYNDKVKPINLPAAGAIPTGFSVFTGWGTITTGMPTMPTRLQTAFLEVMSLKECQDAFIKLVGGYNPLADTNVCTGPLTGGLSACMGDSGGPLAQGNTIIGIASWVIMPCGTKGAPAVYTQVSSFTDFIFQHIK